MSKKRFKNKKKERRLAEISRAHSNFKENTGVSASVERNDSADKSVLSRGGYHELPIKEIKKDMIKNAGYLLFAIIFIVLLERFGVYAKIF